MPDYPPEAVEAAASAIGQAMIIRKGPREIAVAALDAAAPVLAEAVAQKILAHMDAHGPRRPRGPLEKSLSGIAGPYRTWRRHFGIAARIAAGAFDTREDQLRKAAEAIKRGDFIACNPPEVPGAAV